MKYNVQRKKNKAFTLMEVMLAIMILGILAALVGPGIVRKMRAVTVNTTKTTMENLKATILDYKMDIGHFPTKREGGLEAIVIKPNVKGMEKWDGPYLSGKKEVPMDGWHNEFEYNTGAAIKNKEYRYFEIISYGADGEPGGEGENTELHTGE